MNLKKLLAALMGLFLTAGLLLVQPLPIKAREGGRGGEQEQDRRGRGG